MKSSIISVGDSYRIFGSEVATHDTLPVGTYTVDFDPMGGFSLRKTDDMTVGLDKVYGRRDEKVEKVMRAYRTTGRNLGLMLSGDKGQGKSLFLRMVATRALEEGLPVVRVTSSENGLADFLDSLGECMVVFDEFEKVFPKGGGRMVAEDSPSGGAQDQFLSLFDGSSSTKRMYCVTVNELRNVSDYLLNRPGRFHYHIRFDYPNTDDIREYMTDQVPDVTEAQINSIVMLSNYTSLNYDHLQAIAFELSLHGEDADVSEIVEDLNIKPVDEPSFLYVTHFEKGKAISAIGRSPFGEGLKYFAINGSGIYVEIGFDSADVSFDPASDTFSIPGNVLSSDMNERELKSYGKIVKVDVSPRGQDKFTYGAF